MKTVISFIIALAVMGVVFYGVDSLLFKAQGLSLAYHGK